MYAFLFSEHVPVFAHLLNALHVSPCSSLGLRAHLHSPIVMATLKLNFSGHLCLFQSPLPPSHLGNHVEFLCVLCAAVSTSAENYACVCLCVCASCTCIQYIPTRMCGIRLSIGDDPNCHDHAWPHSCLSLP